MSKENPPLVLVANMVLRGKIECVTGLHIGGNQEKLEIGGLDTPVVRDPVTEYPYIPGSSIKGKLRNLLEYITGALNKPFQGELGNVSLAEEIVRLFGIGAEVKELANDEKKWKEQFDETEKENKKEYLQHVKSLKNTGLTRLIIRDALPDQATKDLWEEYLSEENYTEFKAENFVDRLTSAANPRFIERVVAGSKFDLEMVYTVYRGFEDSDEKALEKAQEDLKLLKLALRLLESNFLGKSGSRGYGRVKFLFKQPFWLTRSNYEEDNNKVYQESVGPLQGDLVELNKVSFAFDGNNS
ncbi:MAG TPA: type III-A CRISPR-associated RAMP protein Csm3 [Flavilitoribacter sp.]|nr:type III-A CRISPR-associated RAMP protein Csm3 [Flavilitoribacter sp.]